MKTRTSEAEHRQETKAVICGLIREGYRTKPYTEMCDGYLWLDRAFYLAELFYYNADSCFLCCWPMIRGFHGPEIEDRFALIEELVEEGRLTVEYFDDGPFNRVRLFAQDAAGHSLSDLATDIIEQTVAFMRERGDAEIARLTSECARSWYQAEPGGELHMFIDVIPDDKYRKEWERSEEIRKQLEEVFGGD